MIKVIFQDDDILVLDKPANVVVDESNTNKEKTLVDWLKEKYDRLVYHNKDARIRRGVVHRLDKDTSGILLVAKNDSAFENLQAQFKERKTKKEYLALVHGLVDAPGKAEGAIGRNPLKREKFAVLEDEGKEAVTEYNPISNFKFPISNFQSIFNDLNKIQMRKLERINYNQFTLLKCHPLTGRTHQIRVHLKYISHPIVSDEVYGGRKMVRLDHRWCPRQFLHAKRLGFYHPGSGEWMEVESELAGDLFNALRLLRRFTPRNNVNYE